MNAITLAATLPRRAALLVHALPESDRAWLLDALAPRHRATLEALLDELREIGIAPDDAAARGATESPVPEQARAQTQGRSAMDRLAQLSAQQVDRLVVLLRKEPQQLALTLLAVRPWPWRAAVVRSLGLHGAASLQPLAPALREAVCQSALRQIESGAPTPHKVRAAWIAVGSLAQRWINWKA